MTIIDEIIKFLQDAEALLCNNPNIKELEKIRNTLENYYMNEEDGNMGNFLTMEMFEITKHIDHAIDVESGGYDNTRLVKKAHQRTHRLLQNMKETDNN